MWFQTSKKWDTSLELAITFEVINPGNGRYRRPYVAVFIEDPKGKPVRTVELWYQRGRGARWLRDLRNWYRGEVDRMTVKAEIWHPRCPVLRDSQVFTRSFGMAKTMQAKP